MNAGATILVVDDNPTNLKLAADVLECEGYAVLRALDAEEAPVVEAREEPATESDLDFERLEDCVQFAANRLRPGRRPLLLAKAALVLEDFEEMQRALRIETRKIRKSRKLSRRG